MARRRHLRTVVAVTATLATVCLGPATARGATTPSATAFAPASASAAVAAPGTNLLANGDAEVGDTSFRGYDEVIVPGWQVVQGLPTVVRYGVKALLSRHDPGPADRGAGYFAGGAGGSADLRQVVPLAAPDGGPLPARHRTDRERVARRPGRVPGRPVCDPDVPRRRRRAAVRRATLGPVTHKTRHNTTELVDLQPDGGRAGGRDLGDGRPGDDHAVDDVRRLERLGPRRQPGVGRRPVADGVRRAARPAAADPADGDRAVVRPRLRRDDGEPGPGEHHRQHRGRRRSRTACSAAARPSPTCSPRCTPATRTTWRCRPVDVQADDQRARAEPAVHDRRAQHRRPGGVGRQDVEGVLRERQRALRRHHPRPVLQRRPAVPVLQGHPGGHGPLRQPPGAARRR